MLPAVEPAASTTPARSGKAPALTFDELLARCSVMLGVPGGVQERESLRRVLKVWSEGGSTNEYVHDQVSSILGFGANPPYRCLFSPLCVYQHLLSGGSRFRVRSLQRQMPFPT